MRGYSSASYGDGIADIYDHRYGPPSEAQLSLLEKLGGGGAVLELGVGTGRVAVPLAARGVKISGIDSSEKMLAVASANIAGGSSLRLLLGDMASFEVADDSISLIYAVFNTFFMLAGREEQLRCLRACSAALDANGYLVLELFTPDPDRIAANGGVRVSSVSANLVDLQASWVDVERQVVSSVNVLLSESGIRLLPTEVHYLWPPELDELCSQVGLVLKERWSSWNQDEYTPESKMHVSVYSLPSE